VLSRWYAGICKRADRRFDKLMLREAASLTPLDPTWINDQSAEYSMDFNAARGLEMASQAQKDAFSSSGSSVLEAHTMTMTMMMMMTYMRMYMSADVYLDEGPTRRGSLESRSPCSGSSPCY
jgi:hypothetical protein